MTLLEPVRWKAREHPSLSRGMHAAGAGLLAGQPRLIDDLVEDCQVMTRKQQKFLFNVSRTTIFDPRQPDLGAILFWKTSDEFLLGELHKTCIAICAEVGFSEFRTMSAARGPSARPYWQEMLGEKYRY